MDSTVPSPVSMKAVILSLDVVGVTYFRRFQLRLVFHQTVRRTFLQGEGLLPWLS